jgi:hypothetical protein
MRADGSARALRYRGRVSDERGAVKTLMALALAAGAALLVRRHRDQAPTKEVWADATRPTAPS